MSEKVSSDKLDEEPEIVTTARECVALMDRENVTLPRTLRQGKTTEYEFAKAVIEFYELSERATNSEMDKLLAMPAERIDAALRLEGRDPKDVATIGKQAGQIAMLTVDLEAARNTPSATVRNLDREGWERECQDGDKLAAALGVERTEGGSLNVPKMLAKLREIQRLMYETAGYCCLSVYNVGDKRMEERAKLLNATAGSLFPSQYVGESKS